MRYLHSRSRSSGEKGGRSVGERKTELRGRRESFVPCGGKERASVESQFGDVDRDAGLNRYRWGVIGGAQATTLFPVLVGLLL